MVRHGLQLVVVIALAMVATLSGASTDPQHDCVVLCEMSHGMCEAEGGTYDHTFNCGSAWNAATNTCDLDTTCTYAQG